MNAEPRANHAFTIAHATDLLPEGDRIAIDFQAEQRRVEFGL